MLSRAKNQVSFRKRDYCSLVRRVTGPNAKPNPSPNTEGNTEQLFIVCTRSKAIHKFGEVTLRNSEPLPI